MYFWTGSHHLLSTFLFSSQQDDANLEHRLKRSSSKARSKQTAMRAEKHPSPALVCQPTRLTPPPSPPEARIPLGTVTFDTNANNAASQLSLPSPFRNKRPNKLSTKWKKKRPQRQSAMQAIANFPNETESLGRAPSKDAAFSLSDDDTEIIYATQVLVALKSAGLKESSLSPEVLLLGSGETAKETKS